MAKPFLGGRIVLGTEFSGYKIGLFEAGTSTQKTTYTDSSLTAGNENTHPVVLDANGAAQIYFDGNAKAILYTGADVVVYTDDNINLESTSSATGADNLILNNSFEDDTDGDGIPDNWTRTLYTGGAFALDTTTQSHGSTSAKFTSTGTGGGYLTSTATYAIRPSTSYSVGVNLKSSVADVRNVVEVLWYKADGTASSTASTTLLDDSTTNPTSWTENWYETSSPSDAYFAKIRLTGCHSSDATSGSTNFDDVNFTAGVLRRAKTTFTNTVTMSNTVTVTDGTKFNIVGSADATKKVNFEVDGLTTATTRTITVGDADISLAAATQAEMEAATSLTTLVTPGRAQYHPGVVKWWLNCDIAGATNASHNVTSISDDAVGVVTVTIATDFSSTSWVPFGIVRFDAAGTLRSVKVRSALGAGSAVFACIDTGNSEQDPTLWFLSGLGDQ